MSTHTCDDGMTVELEMPMLDVELDAYMLDVELDIDNTISANFDAIIAHTVDVEQYNGGYSVTPNVDGVTLETSNKYLEKNVTVSPIPVYYVSNDQGGNTIIIGGIN